MYLNIENLKKHDYNVDYIITHDIPTYIGNKLSDYFEPDNFTEFLDEEILRKVCFKRWFAGHYHVDWHYCIEKCLNDNSLKETPKGVLEESPRYLSGFDIVYDKIEDLWR